MSRKTRGRMLNRDIANSQKLAKLSSDSLILFFFLVPFYDSWGKMNGDPHFIKGEILKRYPKFTVPKIEKCLKEISKITSVKWFIHEGLHCIHATNWEEHQTLPKDKRGVDSLPSFPGLSQSNSGTTPELVPPEVKVEVKDKEEGEETGKPVRFLSFGDLKKSGNRESQLTLILIQGMRKNDDKAKIPDNLFKWVSEARLLMDKDERKFDDIVSVIQFSQESEFWKSNILSMPKLRKQFPALLLQSKNSGKAFTSTKPEPSKDRGEPGVRELSSK